MDDKRKVIVAGYEVADIKVLADSIDGYFDVVRCTIDDVSDMIDDAAAIVMRINGTKRECQAVINSMVESDNLDKLPLIIVAADSSDEVEAYSLSAGATDYLGEPIDVRVLQSRIDKAIMMRDSTNRLIKYANRDALTGFWNRNYLENYIKKMTCRGKGKDQAYFILLDMDNFKTVNDTYGHAVGDEVLIRFSEAIRAEIGDTVIPCRLGGDEFVLLYYGDVTKKKITVFAKRILSSVEEALAEIVKEYHQVSVSIGIARYPEDGATFAELYMNADKALYYVKQNGKRGFHFYGDKVDYSLFSGTEKSIIDIEELKQYINETQRVSGAYSVHYDGFKRIYQFVARCIERTRQDVQIVIYTLSAGEGQIMTNEERADALDVLGKCIGKVLRRGDVATKYGESQYVVILMDTNVDNGSMVANRVKDIWRKKYRNEAVFLDYSIDTVSANK